MSEKPRHGEPVADINGNRAGLLRLREQIDQALGLEGKASLSRGYREVDGARFDVMVHKATRPDQMGDPRKPGPPTTAAPGSTSASVAASP